MPATSQADDERENFTTYHVREAIALSTTWVDGEIEVTDFYSHTYISGPKAEAFVEKFCGDQPGDFSAKLKKSPLVDDVEHYHYAIK